ncbi:MAG: flagellar biosynthetic protein FliO [Sulfuriferula multivorans]|uniref:Flagellar protein n=1 Tax=Sulfuriferula multivorans TaxID=1559896 RepID=A0A7C9KYK1_9PROT|nr:flagellar biosynthetic protein FliO [Sulfuriferula multivorans]
MFNSVSVQLQTTRFLAMPALLMVPSVAIAATDTATSMFTVLLSLVLILGGFIAVAWFVRRYLPGMGAQGVVKVVGTTAVGTRERVVVVEVDDTWLLLGVGGGNVRLLHTQPKPADLRAPESNTFQVERP